MKKIRLKKKNVENSEIGPDSETLTSNRREPVDLIFPQPGPGGANPF